ncbi:MAG: PLP-dependent aminotransferase family protein [Christensenellales bacterium]|jgi:2-aminoadipate transaminase
MKDEVNMELKYAKRLEGLSGNAIRDIFKLLTNPEIISFAGGNPAGYALRNEYIAQLTYDLLMKEGKTILQYGPTEGYAPLRQSLSQHVKAAGIDAPESEILPVTGSLQGLDLICKAMIDPGDVVLVEEPTFLGALHTMKTYQADIRPVKTDDFGVIPEDLEEQIKKLSPKFVYIIPTFQNPTGKTLPVERRKKIAEIAAKYKTLVLEDDPYRELRYAGEPLPAIRAFDDSGYVIYLYSVSKTISPGIRVGAVFAKPDFLRKLTICKQAVDVHTSNLSQAIADAYLRSGKLQEHLDESIVSYRGQMNKMLDMLSLFPKGVKCVKPEGGLFIWLELPAQIDASKLLLEAVKHNVAYVAGTHFYCSGGHENTMRLNFSNASLEKIEQGMKSLATVISEHKG